MLYLFKSENTFTSVIQRKKTQFCHKITVLILCVTKQFKEHHPLDMVVAELLIIL